jgi:hypothetical protein
VAVAWTGRFGKKFRQGCASKFGGLENFADPRAAPQTAPVVPRLRGGCLTTRVSPHSPKKAHRGVHARYQSTSNNGYQPGLNSGRRVQRSVGARYAELDNLCASASSPILFTFRSESAI